MVRERKMCWVEHVLQKDLVVVWKCPDVSNLVAFGSNAFKVLSNVVWQRNRRGRCFLKRIAR